MFTLWFFMSEHHLRRSVAFFFQKPSDLFFVDLLLLDRTVEILGQSVQFEFMKVLCTFIALLHDLNSRNLDFLLDSDHLWRSALTVALVFDFLSSVPVVFHRVRTVRMMKLVVRRSKSEKVKNQKQKQQQIVIHRIRCFRDFRRRKLAFSSTKYVFPDFFRVSFSGSDSPREKSPRKNSLGIRS